MYLKICLKAFVTFLISIITLSGLLYLIALLSRFFLSNSGVYLKNNEYLLCGFLAVFYSVCFILSEKKMAAKINISERIYLFSALLLPMLLFDIVCVLYHTTNKSASILETGISAIGYYLILMSFVLSASCIVVCLLKTIIAINHMIKNRGKQHTL